MLCFFSSDDDVGIIHQRWARASPPSTGRNQKTCFQGGKGATAPPVWHSYFQPTRKRGGGLSPPKYLVPQQKLIAKAPQHTAKFRKMPQNAAKCRKMPQNAAKCCKMPQNTAIHRKTPQYTAKRRKTPQNAAKRRKTPQMIAKLPSFCPK